MPPSDENFFDLNRLHRLFAVASLALLAATSWALVADHRREWKRYQETFPERRPLAIEQVWLPDLTIDYHFHRVARFDRCPTCHLAMTGTAPPGEEQPHPYRLHPRPELFLGLQSPHPLPKFGCTICHDGQGSATEFRFASHTPNDPGQGDRWRTKHGWFWNHDWDLPMRPRRFVESGCLRCHCDVSDLEPSERFPDPPAPTLVAGYQLVRQYGCFGCHEMASTNSSGERIGPDLHVEPKVGPSLRSVGDKFNAVFLKTFMADPAGTQPRSRMPRIFGLHEHLEGADLTKARNLERVEIHAVATYLLAMSKPVPGINSPDAAGQSPSAERGRQLFRTQGCLACHRRAEFPEAQSDQGPDLSGLDRKFNTPAGRRWLTSWLRDPVSHAPQTRMPNPRLESSPLPLTEGGPGVRAGTLLGPRAPSPAADIAAFLLSAGGGRTSPPVPPVAARGLSTQVQGLNPADVDELTLLHLTKIIPRPLAEEYLAKGIPASAAGQVLGDAAELAAPLSLEKKLRFVGRRLIRKRGCFGCHDIAGFEDAAPIGPALSEWGRKQESLLAFEQVYEFERRRDVAPDADRQFYLDALRAGRREGFLWQKLRDPRSFDYRTTANKTFNEHLLMGRLPLDDAQREAIMTFILGLVADPPGAKYAARPGPRHQAIVAGRKVLDRRGCAGCHTLRMERWTIQYDPKKFPSPPETPEFDFLRPAMPAATLAASMKTDGLGLARAELTGMPQWNAEGKFEETEDDDGNPQYGFVLWEPAAIAGKVWPVGGASVLISRRQVVRQRAPWGGDFARLLYPVALAEARTAGSTASVMEAWGWGPPPLVDEGRHVQSAWLRDYVLEPYTIRPATVLRMPRFNLTAEEATQLTDYFAAAAGAEPGDLADPRTRMARLEAIAANPPAKLQAALRLVTDPTTYCAKCHLIGDYQPGGLTRTILAPSLDRVGRRLRPDHLRRWLANPRSVLPYTAMPVNFPPDKRMGQDLCPGDSLEQLDTVMDVLLNYDGLMKHRTSIRQMIESASPVPPPKSKTPGS